MTCCFQRQIRQHSGHHSTKNFISVCSCIHAD